MCRDVNTDTLVKVINTASLRCVMPGMSPTPTKKNGAAKATEPKVCQQ